jgi:hypothetical protein
MSIKPKNTNNGNYGGSIEIIKLNKKELKLAWKKSREPYMDEIIVMGLTRQ